MSPFTQECISQIKDEHLPAYGDPQNSLKLSGQTGAKVFSLLLTNTPFTQERHKCRGTVYEQAKLRIKLDME